MMNEIVVRLTMEVLGSPKEHVDKTLRHYLDKLKDEKDLMLVSEKVHESIQQDNKMWSTFAEIEVKVNGMKKLLDICFDYLPSNVEIIEPAGMEVDLSEFADNLNDLLATMHKYTMAIKKLQAENIYMMKKLKGEID